MSCGTALEARRNSDERWTFTPSSKRYTFSGMAPLFTVRRGETVLLQIDQTQTVNGSLFSVVGDSVVLQLKKGDAALLDGPTPDTDAEALFYDVTLTDQTGFENWIVGGSFTLLGLNDVSCGGCNEKVEVTIGGQCIQINIEGGSLGIGASVNLAALNKAVQDAETAAGEAAQSAADASTAGATAGAAAGSASGAAAGSVAGDAAGTAAAQAIVATKANLNADNLSSASDWQNAISLGVSDNVRHASVKGSSAIAAGSVGFLPSPGGFLVGGGDPRMGPTDGAYIGSDGHGNWTKLQSNRAGNPTELIVYSSAFKGRAQGLNGTNTVQHISGDALSGMAIGDTIYFAGLKLKISGKPAANQLSVTRFDGSPITFDANFSNEPFNWIYTTGTGVADIVGGQVKFVSGTPFVPLFFSDFRLILNGVTYAASDLTFIDQQTYGFTGVPPADASELAFSWRGDINDQNTTLRVQLDWGANEENVNIMSFAAHPTLGRSYQVTTGTSGLGKHRPLFVGAGYWGPGDPKVAMAVYPNLAANNDAANRNLIPDGGDFISLGGMAGNESLRVINAPGKTAFANRVVVTGSGLGFAPSLRVMGTDTNINFGLDSKGSGGLRLTQDFNREYLAVNGPSGFNAYIELNASTGGVASVVAKTASGATTADLLLASSGSGSRVRIGVFNATVVTPNGHIEIKTAAGEVFRISGQKV